jgi:hypothetical protein
VSDGRLFEPTRPRGRPRRRGAASTDPEHRTTTTRVRGRGRPARGATPPPAMAPRRRRRRFSWTRITALLMCMVLVAGAGWLVAGPWLRIRAITYQGADWTPREDLDRVTLPLLGRSALTVDGAATAEELAELPGVESASVDIGLFGRAEVSLIEGEAVAVWLTDAARLLVAEDGTVVGIQARDATGEGSIADLPVIDDVRASSHDLSVGDRIARLDVDAALLLADLDPDRLGSQAAFLNISLDGTYGFILSSPQAGWQAALGYYGLDPADTPEVVAARVASQASGIRTLFASHPEASVAWIDARNPGRVYFRARG